MYKICIINKFLNIKKLIMNFSALISILFTNIFFPFITIGWVKNSKLFLEEDAEAVVHYQCVYNLPLKICLMT